MKEEQINQIISALNHISSALENINISLHYLDGKIELKK